MKPESSHKTEKSVIRRHIRQQRKQLDPVQKSELDGRIQLGLMTLIEESNPACVAAFWPFDGEPDLRPALDSLVEKGVIVALPVIEPALGGTAMNFHQWFSAEQMALNRYGIPEPDGTPQIKLDDIQLLLMPLVAWNECGVRLGMGAGYYDRALQPRSHQESPLRAGVAYQLQKAPELPADPWDIPLHGVLSESGWFECPASPTKTRKTIR